jgi:hypothetical protein
VTFVEVAFLLPGVTACAIWVLWLLAYTGRKAKYDQMSAAKELDHLDELRWNGWSRLMGWPPVPCWQGCANLHTVEWWRAYLTATCWDGCAGLHREDWWRAYVDEAAVDQAYDRRKLIQSARMLDLGRSPQWPSSDDQVLAPHADSPVFARLSG